MLIVITSEQEIKEEAILLNQLFEEGLDILHLRKPTFYVNDYRELLKKIDSKFYNRIMIHDCHGLCREFKLKGVHIQEQARINLENKLQKYVDMWRIKELEFHSIKYKVSSSFHEPQVLANCNIDFDYHLLSPVFSSISKVGYEGRGFDVNSIDKTIIGMGGVNAETIPKVLKLGYKGIGVLGGVWNTENPIESFKAIKKVYETNN